MKIRTYLTAAAGAALLAGTVAVAQTYTDDTTMDEPVAAEEAYPSDQTDTTYEGYQSTQPVETAGSTARLQEYEGREGRMSEEGYMVYGEESGYVDRGGYRGYASDDVYMAGERG